MKNLVEPCAVVIALRLQPGVHVLKAYLPRHRRRRVHRARLVELSGFQ